MENNKKTSLIKTLKDIIKVSFSNILKMFSGILVGFLLPKIIGISDYGYYKTFTLYITYVGLFGIGIIDGVYLKYGGKSYQELDKKEFRTYSKLIILLQLLFCIIGLLISFILFEGDSRFIFICVSLYLFVGNITSYYQFVSQIVGRFSELSFRNILHSLLTAGSILILWAANHFFDVKINYAAYTILYLIIFAILTFWYMFTYKDITFGERNSFISQSDKILNLMKIGIPLLIANLCSIFILSIDRQFVNILFDNNTYAIYAFAYNMLTLVTTAMSAISTVIYPSLKQKEEGALIESYSDLINDILIVSFACLLCFYPACWIVDAFLPQYHASLTIIRIIFPGLAASSAVTIVMHNYYKVTGENKRFFIYSIIILLISGVANYLAYSIFKTTTAISMASIVTLFVWYALTEWFLVKKYKIAWCKNFLYLLIMTAAFYAVTSLDNYFIGLVVHVIACVTITVLFNKSKVIEIIKSKIHNKQSS